MPKKNRRNTKKRLRFAEKLLREDLLLFLNDFQPELPFDSSADNSENFRLLLNLRWLIYEFIKCHLQLNSRWKWKDFFLELIDVEEIKIKNKEVALTGDVVWWAEGRYARGKWWNDDQEAYPSGFYKIKLRGDLEGGFWVKEPVVAKLRLTKNPKGIAAYEIDFGSGSTYLKIRSK